MSINNFYGCPSSFEANIENNTCYPDTRHDLRLWALTGAEKYRLSGLSLFELLIVLLLLSLLFAFGLPFTTQWYQNQLSGVMQKDIEQAIEYGTQESLILGEPVRLVPLHDNDWSSGLVLLRERDFLSLHHTVLYTWQWRSMAWHVAWHGFLSDSYLRFTPDLRQSALNGYFFLENEMQPGIKIMVNRVGRVRRQLELQ